MRKNLKQFFHASSGAVVPLIAVIGLTITALTSYTMDISRVSAIRAKAQQSLDSAALAAMVSRNRVNLSQEANNFFRTNYPASYMNSSFAPVNVAMSGDGTTATFSTGGFAPYYLAQIFGASAGTQIFVSTTVRIDNSPQEVSLILDSSNAMANSMGNLKNAAVNLVETLYNGQNVVPSLAVSVISYADAVRFNPFIVNGWLRLPFGNIFQFTGCLSNRKNIHDVIGTPPTRADFATLYDRYTGPFDIPNKVRIASVDIYGGLHPVNYITIPQDDGLRIIFLDPKGQYQFLAGDRLPINVFADPDQPYGSGRFSAELDFVWTNQYGNLVNRSEGLFINFGADYVRSYSQLQVFWMFATEGESGVWEAYNSKIQKVGAGVFYGALAGFNFGVSTVQANVPYSQINVIARDNGNRKATNDAGTIWPDGAQTTKKILDNSDFGAVAFIHKPECSVAFSSLFMSDKNSIQNYIRSLNAAGPTRNNIGMAFGWASLDPRWRGHLDPNGVRPLNTNIARKSAVLLTRGVNLDPAQDDASFIAICNNMRASGIKIYTVAYEATPQTVGLLSQCAGGENTFRADSPAELTNAFNRIGNDLLTPRIIR